MTICERYREKDLSNSCWTLEILRPERVSKKPQGRDKEKEKQPKEAIPSSLEEHM